MVEAGRGKGAKSVGASMVAKSIRLQRKASGTVQGSFRIDEKLLSRWKAEMLKQ